MTVTFVPKIFSNSLNQACQNGDLFAVLSAIQQGERPDPQTLSCAFFSKQMDVVQAVVARGARPNEETLAAACTTGRVDMVRKALMLGARVDEKAKEAAAQTKIPAIIRLVENRYMPLYAPAPKQKEGPEIFLWIDALEWLKKVRFYGMAYHRDPLIMERFAKRAPRLSPMPKELQDVIQLVRKAAVIWRRFCQADRGYLTRDDPDSFYYKCRSRIFADSTDKAMRVVIKRFFGEEKSKEWDPHFAPPGPL